MWFGASSRVALPVMNTRGELVEGVLAVGLRVAVLRVADEHRLVRRRDATPGGRGGTLPLVMIARSAERAADDEALLERLARVAHLVELLADRGLLDRLLVGVERALPRLSVVVDRLGGEHARLDAVVHALQRRRVDHARRRRRRAPRRASTASASTSSRRRAAPSRPRRRARRPRGCPCTSGCVLNVLQQVVRRGRRVARSRGRRRSRSRRGPRRSSRPSSGTARCRRSGRTWRDSFSGHGADRVDHAGRAAWGPSRPP